MARWLSEAEGESDNRNSRDQEMMIFRDFIVW